MMEKVLSTKYSVLSTLPTVFNKSAIIPTRHTEYMKMQKLLVKNSGSILFFTSSLVLLITFVIFGYSFIQQTFLQDYHNYLNSLSDRIQSDLNIENGQIDTTLYNSDPLTPYPNSSSNSPVYIITNDGYVIERSKPINGFLDSSDMKYLIKFQTPSDINTLTNENWRVLSKNILENNEIIGVVTAFYHNPENAILSQIDDKLQTNIEKIYEQLEIFNGKITTENIDIRKIDFTISFEVVSKFNKVLINNGRNPTFIDPSYVDSVLKSQNEFRTIKDGQTGEEFLTSSQPIISTDGKVQGLISVARSMKFLNELLANFVKFTALLAVALSLILTAIYKILLRNSMNRFIVEQKTKYNEVQEPKKIFFDLKHSFILVDDEKHEIAYASNQYYLCKALFSKPEKRWENDELLEAFGEESEENNHKKVYDTALAINKKLNLKFVLYKDKTFSVNSDYVKLLQKSSI